MKTKFIYVIMAVLLMGSQMTLSAQNTDNKQKKQRPTPEQMVQMQTKQIVNTLMLDDATAAKFTPVYEKYLKELRECRMMTHKARTEKTKAQGTDANAKKERPSMTDDEIATMLRNQFTQSRKMLDIREMPKGRFMNVDNLIPAIKNAMLLVTKFDITSIDDGKTLNEAENIHASLIGLAVDYLTRFMMGTSVEEAFKISLQGALCLDLFLNNASGKKGLALGNAKKLLKGIKGLDNESVSNACKLVGYDVCFRKSMFVR